MAIDFKRLNSNKHKHNKANIRIGVSTLVLGVGAATFPMHAMALAPVISTGGGVDVLNVTVVAGNNYSYELQATDPEGAVVYYDLAPGSAVPSWLVFYPIIPSTGTAYFIGTPTNEHVGSYSFVARATDSDTDNGGDNLSDTQTINIEVIYNANADSDGDGMPDGYETSKGFDPFNRDDALLDADGDGKSNLQEYNLGTDPLSNTLGPVVTVPAELTVDPYGLYTMVDPGVATAADITDGQVAVSASGRKDHYRPGHHSIRWSAHDNDGYSGSGTQYLNVRPFVELGSDVSVVEGGTGTLKVVLNGTPPSYPVTIVYKVSGTVGASEHNLVNGTATISEPNLEGEINIEAYDDGVSEPVETVTVQLTGVGSAAIIGANDTAHFYIHEGNLAPRVKLSAAQGGKKVRTASQTGGLVVVTADISDANASDTHAVSWLGTDNSLVDADVQDALFTFDPTSVNPGVYTLRVDVCDQQNGCGDAELALTVVDSLAALEATTDADGDGIVDSLDGYDDSDDDGVPNYLDGLNLENALQAAMGNEEGQYQLESDAGSHLALGDVAIKAAKLGAQVTMDDAAAYGNNGLASADSSYAYNGGLYDFRIEQLASNGESVKLVIPLSSALPANALYRHLTSAGWLTFTEDDNNMLASAIGEDGFCPPPGSESYGEGLTEGHWCVQLTVSDGGANDADGKANGRIANLGGVVEGPAPSTSSKKESSGLGAFSPGWLLLGLLLVRRRFKV